MVAASARGRGGTWRCSRETGCGAGARRAALVSFGMGSPSKHESFPRRRESSPWTMDFPRFSQWIPAFAGMTAACNAHIPQMRPAPGRREIFDEETSK
jgi:hypothetical protein